MEPVWPYLRQYAAREWLVIGKGPSFSLLRPEDCARFKTVGLNHVCRSAKVDLAHVTDHEVLKDLVPYNFQYLVTPYHLHVSNKPSRDGLLEMSTYSAMVDHFADRTFYYRSSLATKLPHPNDCGPTVTVRYFSAVAVVSLLALAGVKRIRTIGIDGGDQYAEEFKDFKPLTNGRNSFDVQFGEIAKIVKKFGIEYRPLIG